MPRFAIAFFFIIQVVYAIDNSLSAYKQIHPSIPTDEDTILLCKYNQPNHVIIRFGASYSSIVSFINNNNQTAPFNLTYHIDFNGSHEYIIPNDTSINMPKLIQLTRTTKIATKYDEIIYPIISNTTHIPMKCYKYKMILNTINLGFKSAEIQQLNRTWHGRMNPIVFSSLDFYPYVDIILDIGKKIYLKVFYGIH